MLKITNLHQGKEGQPAKYNENNKPNKYQNKGQECRTLSIRKLRMEKTRETREQESSRPTK